MTLDPRLASLFRQAATLRKFHKLAGYEPYAKQREFHALGANRRERALIAANRVGKSECCAAEVAMHLTGEYPDWWQGRRFEGPNDWWVGGVDGTTVRDVQQAKLCGRPGVLEEHGSGYIPKDAFVGLPSRARGTTDLYDTYWVRHKAGGVSSVAQKTYGEGRIGWQAATLHGLWCDEEPPEEVYDEGYTRLATTKGLLMLSCTPLLGRTPTILRFMEPAEPAPERGYVNMGIYDAGHFTKEEADALIAGYPAHTREARAYGVPQLGEGKIFTTPEAEWTCPRIDIPPHWAKLWGLDFGGAGASSHPFAAALIGWDRDHDIIYLLHVLKMQGMTRLQHIPKIREIAADVRVAWPHDMRELRESGASTATLADQYKKPMPGMPGLMMLPDHSTWPEGGFSTEAAIDELDTRMQTGRFKVFEDLRPFFDEARLYHREDGLVVKLNDDILSALYKALMMKRFARPGLLSYQVPATGLAKYQRRTDDWWNDAGRRQKPINPFTNQPESG